MLMNEAIEKTEMEREVSLRIARRGWVKWYSNVRVSSNMVSSGSVSGEEDGKWKREERGGLLRLY